MPVRRLSSMKDVYCVSKKENYYNLHIRYYNNPIIQVIIVNLCIPILI